MTALTLPQRALTDQVLAVLTDNPGATTETIADLAGLVLIDFQVLPIGYSSCRRRATVDDVYPILQRLLKQRIVGGVLEYDTPDGTPTVRWVRR